MEYSFTDIFDVESLTKLCESYTQTNGVVTALLDLDGNVHVKSGWQDICTKFHRVNPTSSKRCTESDTILAGQLAAGNQYNIYRCKNGLVDVAVPVIIDGEHVANFFTGQFFFEEPDHDRFVKQGEELGYDLIPYVDALNKVPIFKEDDIKRIMDFLVNLAQVIGEMGKAKLELLKAQKSEHEKVLQLEAAHEELEKLASEDPLTGLCNRRKFSEKLNDEIVRAHRYKHELSLAMVDVDFFKAINDTLGHAAGDHVLKCLARILKDSVRTSDVVARMGGDEFCILFPETHLNDARLALEKIIETIKADDMLQASLGTKTVSCSMGLASINPRIIDGDALLINADKALYQAKHQGRNQVILYREVALKPKVES